jgi:uncharacterized membrane protein YjjP (DUF1212 family)
LHAYGYPAHRLEDALILLSRRLGLHGQFFSMPTALFASFGEEDQRTFQIRVEPGGVNLEKLTLLEDVIHRLHRGELNLATGSARIDEIEAAPTPYGAALSTIAFALASGAASRFFGGGWREVAAATVIGLVIGLLALLAERVKGADRVFEPTAALAAAFLAAGAARWAGQLSAYTATMAGLIVLVPGFGLTVAMTELATRNLVSGISRLAGVSVTFLAIGLGVALGTRLGDKAFGTAVAVEPLGLPGWTLVVALVVAPLGFTVLLRAQPRDAGFIVLAGILAFLGARFGAQALGPELGAFVGALAVGVASNAYARALDRPAGVTLVPGILLLVPGSLGFRSLSSLMDQETVLGVEAAFRMTLIAVSLATGLLFSNVLLPVRGLDKTR